MFKASQSITPDDVYFGNLTQVKSLGFYKNHINEFPPEIGKLINLEDLNRGANETYVFTKNMVALHSLKCLDLSNNKIPELPNVIFFYSIYSHY